MKNTTTDNLPATPAAAAVDPEDKVFDLIVVGGGAAGLIAAGTAARDGKSVLLIEKMEKTARKVNITGKGRCNLTNMCPPEEFLAKLRSGPTGVEGAAFFTHAFKTFTPNATCHFFKKQGVKLEEEAGRRIYPKGGKAYEISDALRWWCSDNGVVVMLNTRVDQILEAGGRVYGVMYTNKRGFPRKAEGRAVLLTTGGATYPLTGSTGDGYRLARDVGHSIVPVRPSLVALRSNHPKMDRMVGTRLKNIRAELIVEGETVASEFGEIEFSERGIDGPVVLRMSRAAVDAVIEEKKVEIALDLKPALDVETLQARIARELEALEKDAFAIELLRKMLPRDLVYLVADSAGVHPKTYAAKLSPEDTDRMIGAMKRVVFPVVDYGPWEQAIVTAGGVSLDEVDPETLQSRVVKGLYLAGEVLDLDADTGGYNLQIAFSTGRLAAQLKGAEA
ncbi:MAG: aminoacetone oxidase family FAD-binding enzyme [Alistipes sp.]|jgi:predicted Rossmann fold flavoprotein|nr:aminoacetone oxidase family FAD-binding enzyme [Alistipes sp.]